MTVLEELTNLYDFSLMLLTNEQFGLRRIAQDSDDLILVDRAIELLNQAKSGESISCDDWTALKEDTFRRVGSPLADAISRICSCMRNPSAAGISGLRDAIEKLIQANVEASEQRVRSAVQREVQHFLRQSDRK
jgi:hypothetical protein